MLAAIPTIAREIKLSEATVRRGIQNLEKAGLIKTEQRYRTKGGKSSLLYNLKWDGGKNLYLTPRGKVCLFGVSWQAAG